eukprot:scaffold56988_cov32-Tisochrysis_lutea.AAC.5
MTTGTAQGRMTGKAGGGSRPSPLKASAKRVGEVGRAAVVLHNVIDILGALQLAPFDGGGQFVAQAERLENWE